MFYVILVYSLFTLNVLHTFLVFLLLDLNSVCSENAQFGQRQFPESQFSKIFFGLINTFLQWSFVVLVWCCSYYSLLSFSFYLSIGRKTSLGFSAIFLRIDRTAMDIRFCLFSQTLDIFFYQITSHLFILAWIRNVNFTWAIKKPNENKVNK